MIINPKTNKPFNAEGESPLKRHIKIMENQVSLDSEQLKSRSDFLRQLRSKMFVPVKREPKRGIEAAHIENRFALTYEV